MSFHNAFNLPLVMVRPFNAYGPRQSARAIIPTILTQLLSGKNEIRLGSLHPTRDLVYVKDTVEGFLEIARSDKTIGEEINISTQTEISVADLAYKIISLINPAARVISEDLRRRPVKSEVERLLGSNEKIRNMTNWQAGHTLEEGLRETIEWFRDSKNLSLYKADIYNQ